MGDGDSFNAPYFITCNHTNQMIISFLKNNHSSVCVCVCVFVFVSARTRDISLNGELHISLSVARSWHD